MGKRRIGELKGHPIIVGDINLKNKHEIHISQLFKELEKDPDTGDNDKYQVATEKDILDLASEILGV